MPQRPSGRPQVGQLRFQPHGANQLPCLQESVYLPVGDKVVWVVSFWKVRPETHQLDLPRPLGFQDCFTELTEFSWSGTTSPHSYVNLQVDSGRLAPATGS